MSSSSMYPTNTCRQGIRLTEPDPRTIEQINGGNLSLFIWMPYARLVQYAPMLPSTGPDTLTINYTDMQGQPGSITRNLTLFMSDASYVFIGNNGSTQFLIDSLNPGGFWDLNFALINARNAASSLSAIPDLYSSSSMGQTFSSSSSGMSEYPTSSSSMMPTYMSSSSLVPVSATSLMPCCNPSRYDAPDLLPNQQRPGNFVRDGVLLAPSSSSLSGS